MGHYIESRFVLVDDSGGLHPLDPEATPKVVAALGRSGIDEGACLHVVRHADDGEMVSQSVAAVTEPSS